jgi:hypothetical protein
MANYNALIAVPVGDVVAHVGFKLDKFRSPVISDDVVDVVSLVEAERETLEALAKELKARKPNVEKIAQLQEKVSLPEFLSTYVESGQTTNAIFDILPQEEFEEATIGESKVDLKAENAKLAARIAELEGQSEEDGETGKVEKED